MLDEINTALEDYFTKWHELVNGRQDKDFFMSLKPTAVGWKVEDRASYDRIVRELHDQSGYIAETWMNDRWVAKLVLNDIELKGSICIVKILLKRPDSYDAPGLDHVDFYSPDVTKVAGLLDSEPDLECTSESNAAVDDYNWISIWFEGTEAKIKSSTVLGIVSQELKTIEDKIIHGS